jgi:hypothetical protein
VAGRVYCGTAPAAGSGAADHLFLCCHHLTPRPSNLLERTDMTKVCTFVRAHVGTRPTWFQQVLLRPLVLCRWGWRPACRVGCAAPSMALSLSLSVTVEQAWRHHQAIFPVKQAVYSHHRTALLLPYISPLHAVCSNPRLRTNWPFPSCYADPSARIKRIRYYFPALVYC